ncbi:DnaJ domain-containing protein, partial [bacterium AH-315-F18]|nr:DnaJ domain-containing protein [bacterium AH-315-F18]
MGVRFVDYYQVLGTPRSATPAEIKRAYRKLARKYHPDVSKETDAEDRFKEIGEAYEVLKDPEKRQLYNQLGANWKAGEQFSRPPGFKDMPFNFSGSPGGFSFGGSGGGGQFSDFFDMLFSGNAAGGPRFARGNGRGPFGAPPPRQSPDQHGEFEISLEEAFRGGPKDITLETVKTGCGGASQSTRKRLQIQIPPGATDGTTMRLAGLGDAAQ